ncbi:MAG: radical SAM family heme chaperone HemW [Oscillospiraceae bacterium]|nr:radical SAM family heme chaperone HemW [Oscillospiraceae bacterium]
MKKKTYKPLGLYIHIPFCRSKCIYCDFYSLPGAEEQMDRYVSALCRQLAETAQRTKTHEVDTVYFGGGTPSWLGEKRLRRIMKAVDKNYRVAKNAEITLEANPDSAGDWKALRALRRAGFNRISLGVQSADDGQLKTLGRPHTFAQAAAAAAAARRAKIGNVSLDLIYGLPGQTMESWQETVEKAAALEPEHLSCYGLKVEEGTPLWDMQDGMDLPDDDLQADMYLWTVERLARLGYEQYEISNFARPGRESRHNLKYWTLEEYAGFGPGAHSDLGGVRYAYVRDLRAYCEGVENEGDILSENDRIPDRDRDIEYIMLGLRLARGISRPEFEYRFRLPFGPVQEVLEKFSASGHAVLRDGRWRLTPEGFLLSNQIIGQCLEALAGEKRRREEAIIKHDYRVR